MKRLLLLTLSCSLCLILAGCDKNKQDAALKKFIEDTKKAPAQPIEPLPGVKTVSKFTYDANNQRDPFTKVVNRSQAGLRPDQNRVKEVLEAYSLDSLKMVGTLVEGNKTWGIIIAPDAKVYRVELGNYVGQRFGKVIAINPGEIKILETIPDGDTWLQRETSLVLE
jgi:type IV pilus assembly protein PilP